MKEKSDRINHFLLQEQFPDIIKVSGTEKRSGSGNSSSKSSSSSGSSSSVTTSAPYHQASKHSVSKRIVTAEEHVKQLRLESCRCPHLQEYLPRILDLTVCKTTPNQDHPRGWTLANPVHALHMVAAQWGGESSKVQKHRLPPTFMYGDEQHRTIALQTQGIAEYWCSFDGRSPDDPTTLSVQRLLDAAVSSSSRVTPRPSLMALKEGKTTTLSGSKALVAPKSTPKDGARSDLATSSGAIPASQSSSVAKGAPSSGSKSPTKTPGLVSSSKGTPVPSVASGRAKVSLPLALPDASATTSNPGVAARATKAQTPRVSSTAEPAPEVATSSTNADDGRDSQSSAKKNSGIGTVDQPAPDSGAANALPGDKSHTTEAPRTTMETDKKPETKKVSPAVIPGSTKELEKLHKVSVDAVHDDSQYKSNSNPTGDKDKERHKTQPTLASSREKETKMEPNTSEVNDKTTPGITTGSDETKGEHEGGDDQASKQGNKGKADKESQGTQEKRKDGEKTKAESSDDTIMGDANAKPQGAEATTTSSTSNDDRMEIEESTSMLDKAGQPRKKSSVTNTSSQSSAALVALPGTKTDTKDPKVPGDKALSSTTKSSGTGAVMIMPVTSNTASTTKENEKTSPKVFPVPFKSDPRMDKFRREEEKLRRVRRSLTSKRVRKKADPPAKDATKKKRKISEKSSIAPGWKTPSIHEFSRGEEAAYADATKRTNETTERWMRHFRLCHESFWVQRDKQEHNNARNKQNSFYLNAGFDAENPCCQWCGAEEKERACRRKSKSRRKERRRFVGDELMQCLDCGLVGCSPPSLNSDTKNHMAQHMLVTGHKFAISCGEKAQLFCFECGDCVYHEVFEQEKIRIACTKKIPHMAWNGHAVLRSFDPFQFLKTADSGILWKGLVATYPPLVPKEHFCAAQLTLRRQALFEGNSREKWILPKSNALYFAASQHMKKEKERFKIPAPVGIYNLGNTCFMSAILQCLVFCKPLQQYFLRDSGHHFKSCEMFRHKVDVLTAAAAAAAVSTPTKKLPTKSKKSGAASTSKKKTPKIQSEVCLACEMDRLFLSYYGAAVGNDVFVPIDESSRNLLLGNSMENQAAILNEVVVPIEKGDPLIISDLLTSAWKSGGMNHLTGYHQHDAHEFLSSFLELLGKHILKFRHRIHAAVTKVYKDNAFVPDLNVKKNDIIKNVFEGSLRSVLLCESCGVKRVQQEPFMNVSLSLSEEVERMQEGKGIQKVDEMSVESCLEHFVLPEKLGDLVYCNSCGKKTRTKKQHTFAKLPKILCLHLKRFDAAKNKKIENFVSFPRRGLNMGSLLSHWCEVTRLESSELGPGESVPSVEPKILYDLFGTVNHVGNMQSGHYIANVRIDEKWYHCNDQHISYEKEESVLKAEGAYVLFYIRR